MKKTYALLLAAIASAAMFTTPVFATTPACPVCETARSDMKPYPIKVVQPTDLPRRFVKSTVEVALTIDEKGVPTDIRAMGRVDKAVASRLVAAVAEWRFSPRYVGGVPVAGRVVLPIELTATEGA